MLAGFALASSMPPAAAQDPAIEPPRTLKVDVVGTNIPRSDVETALPVQVVTREEIDRSGATTMAEVMSRVSANVLGFNDALSVDGIFNAGLASVNLRGLGDGSTLVLINGRRVANYAFNGAAVDVNQIPLSAVERIEILKDGASAIYGSDAMAGVVNVILRNNFAGAEASVLGSWTERGGGDQWEGSVTLGRGDIARDGYNLFVTASYHKDQALHATQRSFASTGYRPELGLLALPPTTFPANIARPGQLFSPTFAAGCAPPDSLPTTGAFSRGDACGYDVARATTLLPEVERAAVYSRGSLRLGMHEVFAELAYSDNRLTAARSPTPVAPFETPNFSLVTYPATGPYYPTAFAAEHGIAGDLSLIYRTTALGPRVTETEGTAWRAVIGAKGTVGQWEYGAALTYSRNDERNTFASGYVSLGRLQQAMATGLINPFGPSGPEGDALLASTQFSGEASNAKGTTLGVDAKATTELYRLAGGMMAAAVGLEARRESFDYRFVDAITSGDILGFDVAAQPIAGERTVQALFGELSIPFAKGVEAQVAARYDHYSDFGSTVQPKVAIRWQPTRALLMRASWGTGFRAPTLYDLHEPQLRTPLLFFEDPARCPVTQADRDCFLSSAVVGGNPDLEPERSTQVNAGVVWEPVPGTSLAVDYWKISKRNFIGQLNQDIIAENFARFESSNIVRGPVDPAYPNLPGEIETVLLTWQNLGKLETSGIDVDLSARSPAGAFGRFKVSLNGTYILGWKWQPDGINWESTVGKNVLGPLPRWRHALAIDWDNGPWGATLSERFQSGYEDVNFFPTRLSPPPEPRRVSSYDVWDVQVRYTGLRNASIALGVRNLWDRDPPASNQPFTSQLGYDPTYADPRGRAYYARLVYAFK